MTKEQALIQLIDEIKETSKTIGLSMIIIGSVPENEELITSGVTIGNIKELSRAVAEGLKKDPALFKIISNAIEIYNAN